MTNKTIDFKGRRYEIEDPSATGSIYITATPLPGSVNTHGAAFLIVSNPDDTECATFHFEIAKGKLFLVSKRRRLIFLENVETPWGFQKDAVLSLSDDNPYGERPFTDADWA